MRKILADVTYFLKPPSVLSYKTYPPEVSLALEEVDPWKWITYENSLTTNLKQN